MQNQKTSNDYTSNQTFTNSTSALKEDISNLKGDAVALKDHLTEEGKARAGQLADQAQTKLNDLTSSGQAQLKKLEASVRDNPHQSILIAFVAGLATSFLLGRR